MITHVRRTYFSLIRDIAADHCVTILAVYKARFIRRISAVSNAIETIDNEMICFIIYCLNCIRHGRNATYERGLRQYMRMLRKLL